MPEGSTNIFFVRHGQTRENIEGIIQGQLIDCSLDDVGFLQADRVAQRLSNVRFDRIYCSTLQRARQTAERIAGYQEDAEVIYLPDLMEMSFGILEGQSYRNGNSAFFDWLTGRWAAGYYDDRVDQGESLEDVRSRADRIVRSIAEECTGRDIAIVTHGRWLRILLATILDGYSIATMEDLLHRNTAVSHVRFEGGRFDPVFLANSDHLAEHVA